MSKVGSGRNLLLCVGWVGVSPSGEDPGKNKTCERHWGTQHTNVRTGVAVCSNSKKLMGNEGWNRVEGGEGTEVTSEKV